MVIKDAGGERWTKKDINRLNKAGRKARLAGAVLRCLVLNMDDYTATLKKMRNSRGALERLFKLKLQERDWQEFSESI